MAQDNDNNATNAVFPSPVKRLRRAKSQSDAQIYVDELIEDFFTCCICYDDIKRCHMTQCGHNFCEQCIKECLDRKHKCPLCQKDATNDQLIRNVDVDSVLSKLNGVKQEYAQRYVSNIVEKSINESKENAPNAASSPISEIFSKYTAQTLVKYESYYQDMLHDMLKIEHRLREQLRNDLIPIIPTLDKKHKNDESKENNNNNNNNNHNSKTLESFEEMFTINRVNKNSKDYSNDLTLRVETFGDIISKNNNVSETEMNKKVKPRLDIFSKQMNLTQNRFDHSCQLLFKSYENYMENMAPAPFLLPINVTVRLKKRNQFWDIQLKSTDRIGVIIDIIEKKFQELGDPIDSWKCNENNNDNNNSNDSKQDNDNENENEKKSYSFGLLRPLDQRNLEEPLEIVDNAEVCLSELNIRQGTQIHVLTEFVLTSEAPRPCFTYNFVKDTDMKCDYFKCKTCNLNWVCQPCSIQCHKGHELVEFYMNFAPSYACCYCMKKKKCTILNAKSNK